ncbi:hypothetical protein [Vibrio europaeus]|uniref:hypothetical protein n=1 Tax=Vibrio europaeus TaxID=300876 RepID=UPI00148D1B1D|nr:hypothetical protein [Vibrio europaeus]MDC5839396.1 hypothetical protein [Vibrio europaeus]NOH23668.1 hypothetical protein [Vibrio europaeus]
MKLSKFLQGLMGALSVVASSSVWSVDLLEHYHQELAVKPAGVYESIDHLYFITDVECVEDKRSAGSQESKRAEALFYQTLTQEVQTRSVTIEPNEWQSLPIFKTVQNQLVAHKLSQIQVPHQLLADSNLEGCARRQVRVSAIDNFKRQAISISSHDMADSVGDVIAQLVEKQDFEQLAELLTSESLPEVSELYLTLSEGASSTGETVIGNNHYDINGVLNTAKIAEGKQLASINRVNVRASEYWLSKADNLFLQGQSPEQINQYLTLALNADPYNANGWRTLSNLTRSVSQDDALWTARQYFLVSGGALDAWVYLFKALQVRNPEQANQLQKLLKQVAIQWPLNEWEQNQIKG